MRTGRHTLRKMTEMVREHMIDSRNQGKPCNRTTAYMIQKGKTMQELARHVMT